MKQEIRTHSIRMTGTFVLLLALGLWQFDFVITSINANIFLNCTILGVFAFGVVLAYRGLLGLRTELVAFDALKEEFSDTRPHELNEGGDPNWRYYRCDEPGIVFQKPLILGQSFQLCSDEIGRTGDLHLTAGTMSTLVEGIDIRLDEQRSLLNYVTGILVMLGLIGTFVGLMGTLASVGDIIGGLDLSGGAGTEVIQNLMNSLKAPLAGMATGFSSSLFGLITSLTLGLMTRFNSQALNVVRMHFETWLGGVAQIEGGSMDGGSEASMGGGALEKDEMRLLFRVARHTVTSTTKLSGIAEDLAERVAALQAQHTESREAMMAVIRHMAEMAANQDRFAESVDKVAQTLSQQSELTAKLKRIDSTMSDHSARVDHTVQRAAQLLGDSLETQQSIDRRLEGITGSLARQDKTAITVEGMDKSMAQSMQSTLNGVDQLMVRLHSIETKVGEYASTNEEEAREIRALIGQIDQLIALNHLSAEDARALRKLAKMYEDAGIGLSEIEGIIAEKVSKVPGGIQIEEPEAPTVPKAPQPRERKQRTHRSAVTASDAAPNFGPTISDVPPTPRRARSLDTILPEMKKPANSQSNGSTPQPGASPVAEKKSVPEVPSPAKSVPATPLAARSDSPLAKTEDTLDQEFGLFEDFDVDLNEKQG